MYLKIPQYYSFRKTLHQTLFLALAMFSWRAQVSVNPAGDKGAKKAGRVGNPPNENKDDHDVSELVVDCVPDEHSLLADFFLGMDNSRRFQNFSILLGSLFWGQSRYVLVSRMDRRVSSMFFSREMSRRTSGMILCFCFNICSWACWYSKRQKSLLMNSGVSIKIVLRLFSTAVMMLLAMATRGQKETDFS